MKCSLMKTRVGKIGQRILISFVIAGSAVDLWEGRQEIDVLKGYSLDTLPAAGRTSLRAVDGFAMV